MSNQHNITSKAHHLRGTMQRLCIFALALLLSGCGAITERHFPQLYKSNGTPKSVDVVVDTFLTTDIPGSNLGVDLEKNKRMLELAMPRITELLTEKGYRVGLEYGSTGLLFEPEAGEWPRTYYYTKGWKPTEQVYEPTIAPVGTDFWPSASGRDFLKTIEAAGLQARAAKKRKHIDAVSRIQAPIPSYVENLPSDLLVFVSIGGIDIHLAKTVAVGALTAVTSSAVTGGSVTLFGVTANAQTRVSIAVYDQQQKQIIWYKNDVIGPKYTRVATTLRSAFDLFPDIYGAVVEEDTDEENNL